MDPLALGIVGSTQPEVFRGTVEAMVQRLLADSASFWADALAQDGPIEIWVINGERYLYNGNHRFHAAVQSGVAIPPDLIRIVDKPGSTIPTFLLQDLVWLPGLK